MRRSSSYGSLKILAGPDATTRISLDGLASRNKLTFGRHKSCSHVLRHKTVSREHFHIEVTAGKLLVVDLKSGNGTFVNDVRASWVEIKPGDRIRAGPYVMIFEAPVGAGEQPDAAAADARPGSGPLAGANSGENADMLFPREYTEGIVHFNAGRYYEAHEVWEEIWLRSQGAEKVFYQMLIQSAVGLHHFGRSNPVGARGMYTRVVDKLGGLPAVFMALNLTDYAKQFKSFFRELIEAGTGPVPSQKIDRPQIKLMDQGHD
jgi:hypothetical protein